MHGNSTGLQALILLMGGTSESFTIAKAIADAGFPVLVSMATDIPLTLPAGRNIETRHGRLNLEQMIALIGERRISTLVDSAHPYALRTHETAKLAAKRASIPYIHWLRAESDLSTFTNIRMAANHDEAAHMAVDLQRPILLTIGSRNILPYIRAARAAKLAIYARVLPCSESEKACPSAGLSKSRGIPPAALLLLKTLLLLRSWKIGTLVTKESGEAGGVKEKLEAATRAGCAVIVVKRALFSSEDSYGTLSELIGRLSHATGGCRKTEKLG